MCAYGPALRPLALKGGLAARCNPLGFARSPLTGSRPTHRIHAPALALLPSRVSEPRGGGNGIWARWGSERLQTCRQAWLLSHIAEETASTAEQSAWPGALG